MSTPFPSPPSSGVALLRRDLCFKLAAGLASSVVFSGIFRWLQRHPQVEPQMWDSCPAWAVVPFHPVWTWPYLAMFPLIAAAWLLQPSWREVCRFLGAMAAAGLVAWSCFFLWPTGSIRPAVLEAPWYYQMVITADAPLNSFPCLHAAFSVVAAVALVHGPVRVGRPAQIAVWTLAGVICVAAVALRQHTDFDVLAGLVLGGGAGWAYRRSFDRDAVAVFVPAEPIETVVEAPVRD